MHSILSRALGSLDPQMRAVLVLRDMQDLEYSQIAGVLDIPVGTVKSRLFRARMALRTAMEAEEARGGGEH
jgi:RNA polymerase sigma-70 factor (ECF subfamily)